MYKVRINYTDFIFSNVENAMDFIMCALDHLEEDRKIAEIEYIKNAPEVQGEEERTEAIN